MITIIMSIDIPHPPPATAVAGIATAVATSVG